MDGQTDERTNKQTSRKQYAPHFFKVGGIKNNSVFDHVVGIDTCT